MVITDIYLPVHLLQQLLAAAALRRVES